MEKNVILFQSHYIDDFILERFNKINWDIHHDNYHLVLLLNVHNKIEGLPSDIDIYQVTDEDIENLEYYRISRNLVPGSAHFPMMHYFLNHREYKHYWRVEYDVFFNGNWNDIFEDCDTNLDDYDFLSCHMKRYYGDEWWDWWNYSKTFLWNIPKDNWIRSFNPIMRLSNKALIDVDDFQKAGACVHYEISLPTILGMHGFKIGSFGGNKNEFTPDEYVDKWFTEQSMNFGYQYEETPILADPSTKNKLWHPVKKKNRNCLNFSFDFPYYIINN